LFLVHVLDNSGHVDELDETLEAVPIHLRNLAFDGVVPSLFVLEHREEGDLHFELQFDEHVNEVDKYQVEKVK
jgi:hypothetical protein